MCSRMITSCLKSKNTMLYRSTFSYISSPETPEKLAHLLSQQLQSRIASIFVNIIELSAPENNLALSNFEILFREEITDQIEEDENTGRERLYLKIDRISGLAFLAKSLVK
jgi:hypothetical protein